MTHWFLGNKKKISNSLGSVNKINEPFLFNLSLRYAYTLDDVIVLPSNFQRLLRWLSIWFCSYTLRTVQINSVKRYEYFISCLPRVVKHNSLHSLTVLLLCLWVYDLFLYLISIDCVFTFKKDDIPNWFDFFISRFRVQKWDHVFHKLQFFSHKAVTITWYMNS